ncbi:RsmB/NOP family class I SAM-dependent RNA methyltransferase [Bacteriovorax sp. Seq25_V]|uniref:RsmB/NOP family class I SAM-dependent RNA methyltransferase n=1 Tax=Bacteriovorax sp. Seq25_V TaxID=1201288 RepID=UPI0012FA92CD|nr:RsmB/NOP family class I SAM-dependent RNA methyltransferase [Bacteriovorax sp. Seq25_V]
MKKIKMSGPELFESYYKSVWLDRWDKLKDAFKGEGQKVYRANVWAKPKTGSKEVIPGCFESEEIAVTEEGIKNFYLMDPASVIVARNLDIIPNSRVLDMCAAPGGKSLILFEKLIDGGELICNELSRTRKERLRRVIGEYIPEDERVRIDIRGFDGNKYGIHLKDEFDYVLLDAPCSGERHLLDSPTELEKWSEKRTKRLALNQFSLLCSAFLTVKSGGEIVYSTCSLSPLENDDVIEKLIAKKGDEVEILPPLETYGLGESTKYGQIFLPDQCGFGPLYFCRLKKN